VEQSITSGTASALGFWKTPPASKNSCSEASGKTVELVAGFSSGYQNWLLTEDF
jgi:hypothetical protein